MTTTSQFAFRATDSALRRLVDDANHDHAHRLRASKSAAAGVVVVGAHGGAGATTVATLLDPERAGSAVEATVGNLAAAPDCHPGRAVVLVARSTAYGMSAAATRLAEWAPSVPRPWLVLVADSPAGLPLPVRYRLRVLAPRLAGVARLRYLHRLRGCDDPAQALTAPAAVRTGRALRAELTHVAGRQEV